MCDLSVNKESSTVLQLNSKSHNLAAPDLPRNSIGTPLTTNLFFMKIFFHGHENSDFGIHGAKLRHEISMKFFTRYFHGS